MQTTLSILDRSGDMTITWDHADEAARETARKEVEQLRSAGYSFFLVDGSPADEIVAGQGTLIVKRLSAEELIDPKEAETEGRDDPTSSPEPIAEDAPKKRRGRPKGVPSKSDRQAVAVRPLRGG
jgi:hypothetical protein